MCHRLCNIYHIRRYLFYEASEKCLKEKRKTLNGEDILQSLHVLGFGNYNDSLKLYLNKIREVNILTVVITKLKPIIKVIYWENKYIYKI